MWKYISGFDQSWLNEDITITLASVRSCNRKLHKNILILNSLDSIAIHIVVYNPLLCPFCGSLCLCNWYWDPGQTIGYCEHCFPNKSQTADGCWETFLPATAINMNNISTCGNGNECSHHNILYTVCPRNMAKIAIPKLVISTLLWFTKAQRWTTKKYQQTKNIASEVSDLRHVFIYLTFPRASKNICYM